MKKFTSIYLQAPYLIFIGDVDSTTYAKTGHNNGNQ